MRKEYYIGFERNLMCKSWPLFSQIAVWLSDGFSSWNFGFHKSPALVSNPATPNHDRCISL